MKKSKKSQEPLPVPVALKKLVDDLSSSGLLSAEEVAEVVESLPADKRDNAQEMAKALIRQEKLTKFQATAVYQGKTKSLVFGEYVVLDKIGQGGMGMVFRAKHRRMKREVAIKVLPGGSLDDEDSVNRFYQEVEAAAKLLHPNIVTAFDAGQHGESHFLVMEYVEGKDLSAVIKAKVQLPIATAVGLTIQAGQGLEYAHGEGLIHRDVKPANLLVDKKGVVKILDMGLARLAAEGMTDDGLTKSGQIMGTVDYMAPEQATDTRKAGFHADIYSLGCTLYRLLTGHPVFDGDTIMNKMMAHANQPPPDLRTLRRDVSEQLNTTFQKMVAKSPNDRQQSMTQVIVELQSCLGGESNQSELPTITQSIGATDANSGSQLTNLFDEFTPTDSTENTGSTAVLEQTIDVQKSASSDGALEPTVELPAKGKPSPVKTKSRRALLIGLCVLGLLVLLGVMTIFLRTPNGIVRIEVMDPTLEVVVDSTGAVIKGEKKFEEIKLVPGKDKLKIKRGEFEFFTDTFELKKGKNVAIKIDLVKGNVRVVKDGESVNVYAAQAHPESVVQTPKNEGEQNDTSGKASTIDDDFRKQTVMKLLAAGGKMHGRVDGHKKYFFVDKEIDIPKQSFEITDIHVTEKFADDDYARLAREELNTLVGNVSDGGLKHLAGHDRFLSVSFANSRVTSDGCTFIATFSGLQICYLGGTKIDDDGIANLKGATCECLGLENTKLTDAGLAYLKDLPRLNRILLNGTQVSDKGLVHLEQIKRLTLISLLGTKVTKKGVENLKKALPDCDIVHDFDGTVRIEVGNYALMFDGKSSHVRVPWKYDWSHPITIVAYVKLPDNDQNNCIASVNGLSLVVNRIGTDSLRLRLVGQDPGQEQVTWPSATSESQFPLDQRTHVVGQWDGKQAVVFIDGRRAGSWPLPNGFRPLQNNLFIGGDGSDHNFFQGSIDELRISQVARYSKDFTPESRFARDADAVALYHFDDGHGGVVKDSSGNGRDGKIHKATWVSSHASDVVHAELSVTNDQAQPNRQNYALSLDGENDYVELPITYDGKNPMTIEGWAKTDSVPQSHMPIFSNQSLKQSRDVLVGFSYGLTPGGINDVEIGQFSRYWLGRTGNAEFDTSSAKPGQWFHFAVVCHGDEVMTTFVNGKETSNIDNKRDGGKKIRTVSPSPLLLGAARALSADQAKSHEAISVFDGQIDEVRISTVARYDSNFTPKRRFNSDEHTLALYHCDHGQGGELKDSSGKDHHGKIVGAKWVQTDETVTLTGSSPTPPSVAETDRAVVDWVLGKVGGSAPAAASTIEGVDLLGASIDEAAFQRIAAVNNVRWLALANTSDFAGSELKHLKTLPMLTELNLSGAQLKNFEVFAEIANIKQLALDNTSITNDDLVYVGRMKQLTFLNLNSTSIDDDGLKHLLELKSLGKLRLHKTKVTAAGIDMLSKVLPECKCYLTDGDR